MKKQVAKTVALWAMTVFSCWWMWSYSTNGAPDWIAYPFFGALTMFMVAVTVYESTILVVALVMRSLMSNGWTPPQESADWVDDLLDPNKDYVVIPSPHDTEYHIYWLPSAGGKGGCWVGEFWMLDENIQCVDRTMDLEKEQVVTWFVNHALTQFPE